jgi:proteasome lid subunit RPN8/RPN11
MLDMQTTPTKEGATMSVAVEKKFAVEIVYNGVAKSLQVEPEERVTALLQKAIAAFGITQNPHLLSFFRQDGSVVPENESVERAGLKPGEVLLLRPNAVKGGGGLLRLAKDIVFRTFHELRECGRGECECAVYWTGPAGEAFVDGVEHPIHKQSPFGYEIDDKWLTDFWKRLAASKRSVKVQVHTHPDHAFHSATDDEWPIVSQVGFVSIVIPHFAVGEPSLDNAWIGRLKVDGKWQRLASAAEAVILS